MSVALVEVAGQSLGLLASAVEQVRPATQVTRLPGAPLLIEGTVNLGGEIVPVFDTRRRLGISHHDVRLTDQFVMVRLRGRRLAMHVDDGAGVVDVPAADIESATSQRIATFGCAGIVRLRGDLFLAHDIDQLLTPHEFALLERALATVRPRNAHASG